MAVCFITFLIVQEFSFWFQKLVDIRGSSNDLFDDYGGMDSGSHSLTLERMTRTWKIMLESHEIQNNIIFEVTTFSCPSYGKFCNESHRLATLQLETELVNWRSCFKEYVEAQKGYTEALYKWLSKFVPPEIEFHSRGRASSPPCPSSRPNLLAVCHDWLDLTNKLPDKSVSYAIKNCAKDIRALWVQQGEEQMQKRKVDSLSKELDKKVSAFQKAENRVFEVGADR
ncbi:hypothetical protein OROMI_007401 [Orobanche minor]